MKKIFLGLFVLGGINLAKANVIKDTVPGFKTLTDSASYALGFNIGQTVSQRYSTLDKDIIAQGLLDAANKKQSVLDINLTQSIMQQYMAKESEKLSGANIKEGEAFMAINKTKPGVITTASGLQYKVIKMGTGAKPIDGQMVKVSYEGRLLNGYVFDGTAKQGGNPVQFNVNGVIAGWTETLKLMPVGSKFQVIIPHQLGYGMQGQGNDIKPGHTLDFDIELLDIIKNNVAPAVKPTPKPAPRPTLKPTKPIIKGKN